MRSGAGVVVESLVAPDWSDTPDVVGDSVVVMVLVVRL